MQDSKNIVRIGTSPMTPVQFVLKLWPAIQEQCPDIKFQLVPFENTSPRTPGISCAIWVRTLTLSPRPLTRTFSSPGSAPDWSRSRPPSGPPCPSITRFIYENEASSTEVSLFVLKGGTFFKRFRLIN